MFWKKIDGALKAFLSCTPCSHGHHVKGRASLNSVFIMKISQFCILSLYEAKCNKTFGRRRKKYAVLLLSDFMRKIFTKHL